KVGSALGHRHQRGTQQALVEPVARLVLLDDRVGLVLGAFDVGYGLGGRRGRTITSSIPFRTRDSPSTRGFPLPPPWATCTARSRLSTIGRRSRTRRSVPYRTASLCSRAARFFRFSASARSRRTRSLAWRASSRAAASSASRLATRSAVDSAGSTGPAGPLA